MCPIDISRVESAGRIVLAFNNAFNRHDVEGMMKLMTDDCVVEDYEPAPDGTAYAGKEAISGLWRDCFARCTGLRMDIEEILSAGTRCLMRWKCTWTDDGGKRRHLRGVDLYTIKNSAICEKLSYAKA